MNVTKIAVIFFCIYLLGCTSQQSENVLSELSSADGRSAWNAFIPISESGSLDGAVLESHWQVPLFYLHNNELKLLCSGSLITDRHILTTAHCLVGDHFPSGISFRELFIGYGLETKPDFKYGKNNAVPVARYHIHELYKSGQVMDGFMDGYDIAIIELGEPVDFSKMNAGGTNTTNHIPLASTAVKRDFEKSGVAGALVGRAGKQDGSASLLSAHVELISNQRCEQMIQGILGSFKLAADQLCTTAAGLNDYCNGDAGAALVALHRLQGNFLIGINSWGAGCRVQEFPNVYTDVGFHQAWIEQVVSSQYLEKNRPR